MRDFRDAKAMARTLRAALAAKGLNITISQSLELIAKAFGVADWNTLAAAIRQEVPAPRNDASPSPPPIAERVLGQAPHFSRELESTLHRALADANHREHSYATLEHLLLALADDLDASAVMKACSIDVGALRKNLANYVDNELRGLASTSGDDARPTSAFQRVIQRAVIHIQSSGREEVTGANVLVAMFAETESPAVKLLGEQDMTRQDALHFMVQGIVKGSGEAVARRPRERRSPITPEADERGKRGVEPGDVRQSHGRTKPVVVQKLKRRTAAPKGGKTGKNAKTPPSSRPH